MNNNLKCFIIAFVVGFCVMWAATTAMARTMDECTSFYDRYVGPVTDARDAGTQPEAIFQQLVMVGMPQEAAYNLVQKVYFVEVDKNKEEIQSSFMNWCVGTGA